MIGYHPAPKPAHKRLKPKQSVRNKFTSVTIQEIFERDNRTCVRCGAMNNLESIPHHCIYRSHLGGGTKRNGVTICRGCHDLAHEHKEIRYWFVDWVEEYLDEEGNYKKPSPFIMN